jgi:D-alanyl-D-alanine carboxypeptidase/D-alanyl-D-alanine-endopeptidase (penicillin-binding protein 4)
MARAALFKALAAICLVLPLGAPAETLPKSVALPLQALGIPAGSVAIAVQEVGSPGASFMLNAERSMNPASVMKLVTTYAALELLGPAYRWKTEAYLDGEHLVLRGKGDPKLNYEGIWTLLRGLRSRGLREIRGDVVLDRSWFGEVPDGRIDNEAFRPYNVTPDALLVNFRSIRFGFIPDPPGRVRVFVEPELPGLELVNSLALSEEACPEGRAFRDLIGASFRSRPAQARFVGRYPASCGERDLNVALHEPEDYVAGMIRHLWTELGGRWNGVLRNGTATPAARPLYVHESEPLAGIVRDINKFSNNVMARQLYLTLAAERGGAPARPEQAYRSIVELLKGKGVAAPELVMENGSGLSRTERASAATLAALLQAAWKSAVMPEFMSSLPVVAVDGTMRKRLLGGGVAGQAHIKTGLLADARSVAGYVLDRNGRRHAVVMLVNHPRAGEAQAALDAFLEWVYSGATSPGSARSRRSGA